MTEVPRKLVLPLVSDTDINYLLFEDIIDPEHKARFEHFAIQNPELLREIARRAYIDASSLRYYSDTRPHLTLDVQKIIIDNITFALSALEVALSREGLREVTSDAAYGEDQQHSSEPDDDQPAA